MARDGGLFLPREAGRVSEDNFELPPTALDYENATVTPQQPAVHPEPCHVKLKVKVESPGLRAENARLSTQTGSPAHT